MIDLLDVAEHELDEVDCPNAPISDDLSDEELKELLGDATPMFEELAEEIVRLWLKKNSERT